MRGAGSALGEVVKIWRFALRVAAFLALAPVAHAVEGPSAAGPIGGTDIRQALPPPPGIYGGAAAVYAETSDFVGPRGKTVPGLEDAKLSKVVGGPFLLYVPETQVFGGTVAVGGVLPFVHQCGRFFASQSRRCKSGMGDPYVEVDWARYFGTPRASKYPNAFPIPEGLAIMFGLGVVIPVGDFTSSEPLKQAIAAGNNVWDVAPSVAVTYTTKPILAEGTEFSAKLFWNNYFRNKDTDYRTGDLLNVDFSVTEHIGPLQIGMTGFYAKQIEDDMIGGTPAPPNGRRGELLQLGAVAVYDLPAYASSIKIKALTSAHAENTVKSWAIVTGWITKF